MCWSRRRLRARSARLSPPGDFAPALRFRDVRFSKQPPRGLADAAGAVLEKLETSYAALAVSRHRSQGFIDGTSRERLRLIVPHLRRAILIGETIDLQKAETAAYADAFDALAAAIYLVDTGGSHCAHQSKRRGAACR